MQDGWCRFCKSTIIVLKNLFNDDKRNYLELKKTEFLRIVKYSKNIGINYLLQYLMKKDLIGVEEANIELYKIASRTVEDKKLCEKIINSKKKVIISLGMYDYKKIPAI